MKASAGPPLYVKVCLINGAVFAGALALLVVSPATVSHQVTGSELAVLVIGLVVIVATNAALLHTTLAPLDRLVQLLDTFDASGPGQRFPAAPSSSSGSTRCTPGSGTCSSRCSTASSSKRRKTWACA